MSDELAELRARCARLELLQQVSSALHSTLDPQEALDLILREAIRLVRASSGAVALLNPTSGFLEVQAAHGLPPEAATARRRVGEDLAGWVVRTGQPTRVGDVRADKRCLAGFPAVRSQMAVPLAVRGEVRGVLNVDAERLDAFTAADQELLEALAAPAARLILNTWLHEQLRLKARLFETLASVSQTINSTLNLDDTLQVITREATVLMRARMSSLLLLDDGRTGLDLRASAGAGPAYLEKPRLSVDDSLVGAVIRRKKPVQVENVQVSGQYQNVALARSEGLVSLLSVPLLFRGEAIGVLNVYTGAPYHFSNEEITILSALAGLSAIAIEKARLYERLVDVEEKLRQNEKLSALGLLAAEVAHEIRNPLTVMKMLYHSLDLKFPAGDPRAKDAQIMGEKMDLLNRIVEHVLDFARGSEPAWGQVNVNALIDDLALLTRHKLRHQNIELVRTLAPDLPVVLADATQLEQAFLNLTLNAAEAMPQGGRLTIRTLAGSSAAAPGGRDAVVVEFEDTGAGMTDDQRQRAFTSLLSTTKSQGTGLGLPIVRRVLEAHHGQVHIQSAPGRGTTIRLTLPLRAEAGG
jgi:signal transduction histidine kinase